MNLTSNSTLGPAVTDLGAPGLESALQISDLSVSFAGKPVLRNVSLTVPRGQMVALIGPSGAGKSTLMRQACGLITADPGDGQVRACGGVIQEQGRLARNVRQQRRQIAFIFQQFNLVGRLSVLQNVMLGGLATMPFYRRLLGYFTHEQKRAAMAALDFVSMAPYAGQRASTLSGGQQQRVAVARALIQQAQLIFADEPIASLDPESARLVMGALHRVNQEAGVTVVVSLHQVEMATRYCDRIVAMKDGQIACDCSARELDLQRLRLIYGQNYEDHHAAAPANSTTPGLEAMHRVEASI